MVDEPDQIRDRQRLGLVVRDEHRRRAPIAQDLHHLIPQRRPESGVERREWFVEQHEPRARRERPGERDALLLTTGQLVRVALAETFEPHEFQHLVDPSRAAFRTRQTERDVPGNREVREQVAFLGNETNPAPLGRHEALRRVDELAVDRDGAGIRSFEPGHQAQERRFPAPRLAEQRDHGTVGHFEVEVVEHRACRRTTC